MATLRVELGPCDDDAYFFMNGAPAVNLRIDQTRTLQRELSDGAYDFRFLVVNSGGWGWKARARILRTTGCCVCLTDCRKPWVPAEKSTIRLVAGTIRSMH